MPTRRTRLVALASLVLALAVVASAACKSSPSSPPPDPLPVVACDSSASSVAMQSFDLADVGVHLDSSDPMLDPVAADLATYLGATWGGVAPLVTRSAPDFSKRATIWLSTSDAAAARAGAGIHDGYALKRVDDASGRAVFIVYAKDAANLAFGAYAFLEELGLRFFHPKEDFVPRRTSPALPAALDVQRAPATRSRGLQLHTLHPIEWFRPFNEPSPENLADAKRLIDWLVKTGQNYVQWVLLATVDYDAWRPHAQAIVDYAHARGVRVGSVVQVWGGAALQNNYVLVSDPAAWQAQMDGQIDRLLTVSWDVVELALGEFKSVDATSILSWLDHATARIVGASPTTQVNAQNHVGNFAQLYVPYEGQTVFYYHLPKFADGRLGQSVHTLFFFDVYRDWAMYDHPDFHLQHDFLFEELPTRRVTYFPESAYWITADVDVPIFLPEFVEARWNDIHGLTSEIAHKGLPRLYGHVTFSSGHEWGYWMTDYLTAKMLWDPSASLDSFFAHYAAAYGSCAGEVASALSSFTALQSKYLFDERLVAYLSGEDTTVDLGYIASLPTHPRRVPFEDLLAMSEADRASFESSVVAELEAMAAQVLPIEDAIGARCRGADAALAPWCDELWDGIAIDRLRLDHAALVYRAVLDHARGGHGARAYLDRAVAITAEAAIVVARRERHYRFDPAVLAGSYANATHYPFGYLRQAHTQCFWRRREAQVQAILDDGVAATLADLPSCDN